MEGPEGHPHGSCLDCPALPKAQDHRATAGLWMILVTELVGACRVDTSGIVSVEKAESVIERNEEVEVQEPVLEASGAEAANDTAPDQSEVMPPSQNDSSCCSSGSYLIVHDGNDDAARKADDHHAACPVQ